MRNLEECQEKVIKILKLYNDFGCVCFGRNHNYKVRNIIGLEAVNKSFNVITYSEENGQETQSFVTGSRAITIAGTIKACGNILIEDLKRSMLRILHHLPLTLEVHTHRVSRKIRVNQIVYDAGDTFGNLFAEFTLQLICDMPWFNDLNPTVIDMSEYIDLITPTAGGFAELPAVWSTRGTSNRKIINSGDEISRPKISMFAIQSLLDAPEGNTHITLRNDSTKQFITLENYRPVAGEVISVDTYERTVTSSINGSIDKWLSDDSFLSDFWLKLGENVVSIENTNTDINLATQLEYENNYAEATYK